MKNYFITAVVVLFTVQFIDMVYAGYLGATGVVMDPDLPLVYEVAREIAGYNDP